MSGLDHLLTNEETLEELRTGKELFWLNNQMHMYDSWPHICGLNFREIDAAAERLERFAPVIMHYFPETEKTDGIIESPLTEIAATKRALEKKEQVTIPGRLFLKRDSDLPISGSVKARGGIYEVLKFAETVALKEGILASTEDDYLKLTTPEAKKIFGSYKIQVGSTGNLGMSIGIMGAALGFEAIVHMSADAKQWKKDLLRERGAKVIEYEGNYSEAVAKGREASEADESSYFVDDENSKELLFGYAVAGRRVAAQLEEMQIPVDGDHPLFVYIPCGVGGAPTGIMYGLKLAFKDNVHVFYAEPTQAPCMLIGIASGKYFTYSVQDYGLSGKTEADGLAVSRCSLIASRLSQIMVSGEATIEDAELYPYMQTLWKEDGLFIEPSAAAAFKPMMRLLSTPAGEWYRDIVVSEECMDGATHMVWATGGGMMPEAERRKLGIE